MNELFDKLILRMVFALFLCLTLVLYRFVHHLIYPSNKGHIFSKFYPSKNSAESLHFFSRLLGIGIVFSEFHFDLDQGFLFAVIDFLIRAVVGFLVYLVSLYTVESIVLYNFDYHDEIVKRRNMPYALIGIAHALGVSFVLKVILAISGSSLIVLLFLWLFALVLIGFATKTFPVMSKLSFNRLLIQQNLAVAVSYFGFFVGWSLIIASSVNIPMEGIKWYTIQVILKILLSLIMLPIFIKGIKVIFNINDDFGKLVKEENQQDNSSVETGYGIHEGAVFFTACYFTIVITGKINFETFYPTF
ncbi:MAG: hypothetical protein VXV96_04625 [Bdellovibrionota bacterium]|jgi:uncharacterized membrane protein YjfL (UPF0719 family)|nr:hypothetical protein [Bdellovibrionota bacterium]